MNLKQLVSGCIVCFLGAGASLFAPNEAQYIFGFTTACIAVIVSCALEDK